MALYDRLDDSVLHEILFPVSDSKGTIRLG